MPDPSPEMIERARRDALEFASAAFRRIVPDVAPYADVFAELLVAFAQSEIARVRQEAMEEAAKIAEETKCPYTLPHQEWLYGFRRAITDASAAIRASTLKAS